MGSVRLLEELTEAGADPGRFGGCSPSTSRCSRCRRCTAASSSPATSPPAATSRPWPSLPGFPDETGVTQLPVETLRAVIEQLARLSFRQRVDELGLREDRADVILPGGHGLRASRRARRRGRDHGAARRHQGGRAL